MEARGRLVVTLASFLALALCASLLSATPAHAQQAVPAPQPPADANRPAPPEPPDDTPAPTPKTITVGEFIVQVATALKLPAPQGGFNAESAAFALRGKGVQIETPATSVLTEADAVKVMDALGYRVVTRTPSRTVNDQQAKLLIATFLTTNPS